MQMRRYGLSYKIAAETRHNILLPVQQRGPSVHSHTCLVRRNTTAVFPAAKPTTTIVH